MTINEFRSYPNCDKYTDEQATNIIHEQFQKWARSSGQPITTNLKQAVVYTRVSSKL
jgi:hypothetical protein